MVLPDDLSVRREAKMTNNETLLQYYVALNWAREIVSDIDRGTAVFQKSKNKGQLADETAEIRQHQIQIIEILTDLVQANERRQFPRMQG